MGIDIDPVVPQKKSESPIVRYVKSVRGRHSDLPTSITDKLIGCKSKGEAKRCLRDFLQSKSV